MPECAPVSTHPGQEGLREAGSGAKTGLEEPHGQRSPVTCLALDAKRALCSPSLGQSCRKAPGREAVLKTCAARWRAASNRLKIRKAGNVDAWRFQRDGCLTRR